MTKRDIPVLWLTACPSFAPAFAKSCAEHGEELLYIHAGTFAEHLLAQHRSQQDGEFPAVGIFIERLHTQGDQETREFSTIGILESIQNVWGHAGVAPEEFLPFLQPASAEAWHNLNRFWAGEIAVVPDQPQSAPDDRAA